MSEDDVIKRLAACKDIAELFVQGKDFDNLTPEQFEKLELVGEILEIGISPDYGMMKRAGLTDDEFNKLIPNARIASQVRRMKETRTNNS